MVDNKRYFLDGKEISKEKAEEIEAQNLRFLESGDFSLMAKIQFIVAI